MASDIDIEYVSRLARLPLTAEESSRFAGQFARLFEFIAELQQLDVSQVHPTALVIPSANVFREDEVKPCLSHDDALANAPDREGPFFKGPPILT